MIKEIRKIGHLIENGPIKIWVENIGSSQNPAVVLICGAGAHAHFWTDCFCEQIANAGYFVIRFDHRDVGYSSAVNFEENPYTVMDLAQDVIAIMDSFGFNRAHVVGHSMGGTIAQLLAIYHPDRLLSFTSISVATVGEVLAPPKEIMDALLENKPTQVFKESLDGFMKSWKILNGKLPLDREMAEAYTREMYERSIHPVGVAWNHIRCQQGIGDLSNNLQTVTLAALFIHGEKDCLMPVEGGAKTAKSVKNARLEIVPKMGHMIFNKDLQKQLALLLIQHFAAEKIF